MVAPVVAECAASLMRPETVQQLRVIDSHTGGEPTRVLIDGVPDLEGATMQEKRAAFARDYDWMRSAVISEPRGYDAIVGALLTEPESTESVAGVIFFNNVGCLNGCLHGTIGVAVTLYHLGRIGKGIHRIDTPTGTVSVEVGEAGQVTVQNVRSYCYRSGVEVALDGGCLVTGDIAWGGNWFFLVDSPEDLKIELRNVEALTRHAWSIREALGKAGITGEAGGEIDHIELFGPPSREDADSKNFVLCPGREYDRSPCGTGTSAKLACLHAKGLLSEGETWRQAGILDTVFSGTVESAPEGGVYPTVSGSAFITSEATLRIDPAEPFAFGIGADR